jgi:hypothetical protein
VRTINVLMAVLFLLAVVAQYNDPDPLRWMAIYGAACAVCAAVAWIGGVPRALPAAVAIVALAWSAAIAAAGARGADYASMFAAWEMRSPAVEQAREATGLLLVAVWMVVVALRGRVNTA